MAEMITFREGVLEALFEEMRADPSVILMGEDVGAAGGVFQQTKGLFEEFGARRIIDTPISESGAFGMAIGAAMAGMRPVFEVMFGDFMTLCMDQLVNQAAKVRYMSNGAATVPLVLRTTMGVGAGLGPQHSQGFHAWAAHVPGLKVVVPSDAADARVLMKAAIRDGKRLDGKRMAYSCLAAGCGQHFASKQVGAGCWEGWAVWLPWRGQGGLPGAA